MTDTGTTPLDFYFDFSSPSGYLLAEKLDAVAACHGRQVNWHPILLGVIFQATGSRPPVDGASAKSQYVFNDFARSARFMGVPYNPPSRFPLPTQNAARAYYWLQDQDAALARRFALAVYRAFFVEDRDISAPEVVLEIAAAQGVDRRQAAGADRGHRENGRVLPPDYFVGDGRARAALCVRVRRADRGRGRWRSLRRMASTVSR